MKKLIALILITVFVSSSTVKLYKDFTENDAISISSQETEDDKTEKELEKENNVKKDKLTLTFISLSFPQVVDSKTFYINYSYFLPNPTLAKNIIPPNTAA
jgi:hypothetical protein